MTYVAVVISYFTTRRRTFYAFPLTQHLQNFCTQHLKRADSKHARRRVLNPEYYLQMFGGCSAEKWKFHNGLTFSGRKFSANTYVRGNTYETPSCAFQISSLLFAHLGKRKAKNYRTIFHSSSNPDIASRNQIRKYATGTAVTGNIQLRPCLHAYWPPLEFPRMPRIHPRLLLFAYTSPQSLERLHDVAFHISREK